MRAAGVQPRPIPMTGNRAAQSHASPKRQREETATGVVRRAEFPCLRCGLGWTGAPVARAWMDGGTRRAGLDGRGTATRNSHASPKRQREETATGVVRRAEFPCLRCGLGWTGSRHAGLDGRGTARPIPMTGSRHSQFPCKPEAPARGNRDAVRTGVDNAATSAGRGARRADPFARASGWPPPPPPRSADRRSPRWSPLRHAALADSA
jgi:hypothetical protein